MIWTHFGTYHRWPTFDDIDRQLWEGGLKFEKVVQQLCPALLWGLAPIIGQLPHGSQELSLSIAGAANCSSTGPATSVFLGMVRTAAAMEPAWRPAQSGEQPWLNHADMRRHPDIDSNLLTPEVLFGAAALAQNEPCFRGGSHNSDQLEWSLNFDRSIRPFADVRRLDDYWRIRERELGQERTEADNRPFSKHPDPVFTPVPTARTAVPTPEVKPAGSLSVTCNLHPLIEKVAAGRFSVGFYYDAVRSAFQAVEHRVAVLAGVDEVGEKLMGIAFGSKPDPPKITVTRSSGGSLESERNGMQFLFKGAMGALRNPRMHGPDDKDNRDEAEELLVFASFLMRRLDIEEEQRKAAASPS
ncbi:TIGR02391 family protein [Streptomyces sp. NPDC058249]|uniref:TIGR02391 family protein n=1 Tax=Streptomyces sp. NPDC058249 TaxID=3346403 RepID=UPI0036E264A5